MSLVNGIETVDPILVVTDEASTFRAIDGALRDLGFIGVHVSSESDLSQTDAKAFSAVFVDVAAPRGDDTARALKEQMHEDAFLPVLLFGEMESIVKHTGDSFEYFDDVISAPIRKIECAIRLSSLIKRRKAMSRLLQANQILTRAQAQKKQLAALVVHDLRNPLAAIIGNIQLLRDSGTLKGEEAIRIGQDLEALADKSMSLCAGLLDVEELEEGLLQARRDRVELKPFFERFPIFYQPMLRARNVSLLFEHASLSHASFDPELMFRVVENLLDNSVRYALKGGRVVVRCEASEGKLRLLIGNDGPPIPESERQQIFDRYYRLDARRQGARANRGLGLYFCKLACESHGGSISVISMDDYPGCFEILIPDQDFSPE